MEGKKELKGGLHLLLPSGVGSEIPPKVLVAPYDERLKVILREIVQRWGQELIEVEGQEVEQETVYHPSEDVVGIDMGLLHFATLSDGSTIENPRYYRKAEANLKKAQEAPVRKKRGSKRRRKAAIRVSKQHRHIRNQRKDFHHKVARTLVTRYFVVFEKLQPANMSKRPKPKQDEETGQYLPNGASAKAGLNKSILDAGWGQFQQIVVSKAGCAGSRVLFVPPRYTSQICSGCGALVKKDLAERWHSCDCGTELDRDHNAALTVKQAGIALLQEEVRARTERSEVAPLRSPRL